MERQISLSQAKNKLTAIVHDVENGPAVKLTRHGKPVDVLLSTKEYGSLLQTCGNFGNSLTVLRKKMHLSGIEITDADFEGLRDQSPGRDIGL